MSEIAPHVDLLIAQKLVYEPQGLLCTNLRKEVESAAYGAYTFDFNKCHILFRVAKITPKKTGQFVTLWKRSKDGPIVPYDVLDCIDFFVISVRYFERLGQFVFPKALLHTKNILSRSGKGGKRALRVYPPWATPTSPQAYKTQAWQLPYFFEVDIDPKNHALCIKLFQC